MLAQATNAMTVVMVAVRIWWMCLVFMSVLLLWWLLMPPRWF